MSPMQVSDKFIEWLDRIVTQEAVLIICAASLFWIVLRAALEMWGMP